MKALFAAVVIALATVIAPMSPAGASAPTQAISIQSFAYSPTPVTVAKGTVVTWTNNDPFAHSVTSDATDTTDPFDSSPTNCPSPATGCMQPSGKFIHTFAVAGTFSYHCRVHSSMHGTVTVTAPAVVTVTAATPKNLGRGASKALTFTGTGFTPGATVSFSGTGVTAGPTFFVSSKSIIASVHVTTSAAIGSRNVTVTDPSGGGSGTCGACLTIDIGPIPTSASPNHLPRGATSQVVTVTGTGFVSGALATVSGTGVSVSQTVFVSSTQLRLTVTVASTAATGARSVTVTNPDHGAGSCAGCLTVT